jgi:hypothetical protein
MDLSNSFLRKDVVDMMTEEKLLNAQERTSKYQMTMEDLASKLSIVQTAVPTRRGTSVVVADPDIDGDNNINNSSRNMNPTLLSARARVSKVLKRLKKPKWRKRLSSSSSQSASDALEAVSESDSVYSENDSSLTSTRSESFDSHNFSSGNNTHRNIKNRTTFLNDDDEECNVDIGGVAHHHHRQQQQQQDVSSSSKSTSIIVYGETAVRSRTTRTSSPSATVKLQNPTRGHQTLPDSFDVWGKTLTICTVARVALLFSAC